MNKLKITSTALIVVLILSIISVGALVKADVANMEVSNSGVDFIKKFEGFSKYAYWDYTQWSIGYGTSCAENEYPNGITVEQATALFKDDLQTYVGYVNAFLIQHGLTINQNQFDALVSFTYNLGNVWNRADFTLRDMIVDGIDNYTDDQVKTAFGYWCYAGGQVNQGLVNRRAAEAVLFLTEPTAVTTTSSYYEIWKIDSSIGLRLRSGAGTGYSQVALIPDGTTIYVAEKVISGGFTWGKTAYNGVLGWCALDYAVYITNSNNTTTATTKVTTATTQTTTKATTAPTTITTATTATTTVPTIATTTTTTENTTTSTTVTQNIMGDINSNGRIDLKDTLLLKQFLADWQVTINQIAADVNHDGRINLKDTLLLKQYLADWEVTLG